MDKFFTYLYFKVKRFRILFFAGIVLLVSSCIYLAFQINFEEDITKILPKDENNDVTAKVIGQLNFSDKITVMIKANSPENKDQLGEIAQDFLVKLNQDSIYYKDIQGIVGAEEIGETFSFVYEHLPLFLNEEDYNLISLDLNKDSIQQRMQQNYSTLISPTGIVARDFILQDPLGFAFKGLNNLRAIGVSKDFIIHDGFLYSADTSTLLLFITPEASGTDTKRNEEFVEHLLQYQSEINTDSHTVANITYFGAPFIAKANADQIKFDITSTVFISLSILVLILIFFYKQVYVPILLFIPAVCGVSVALATLYLTHDSISAISVSIGAILIGITVDYPLHIITHFRQHPDIKQLYKGITQPVLASSMTTAIAFLCLKFVNSDVLQDLGVFAAISIMGSALGALVIIPHLYIPKIVKKTTIIDRIAQHKFEKNKVLLAIILVVLILAPFFFSKVKFNDNIADLNYVPQDMQEAQNQLESLGSIGGRSIYLSVFGENEEFILSENHQIEKKLTELKQKGVIEDYTSIGSIVLSKEDQLKKIQQWNDFWADSLKQQTIQNVQQDAVNLGFNSNAFDGLTHTLNKAFSPISLAEYQSLKILQLDEFYAEKDGFYTISSIVTTDSLHRMETIQSLEKENVIPIDRKHLNEQFLGQIKDDFVMLMNYSFFAVLLIMLFYFRRIELALLAMTPIVLTGFFTTTLVYLLNFELNVFSTIVTTLVIGLGVDFSIFMTSALQKRYTTGEDELSTYRTSIILAVLTTVLAIGVLIFAKHPALKSVSAIALIGITSAMVITFVLYPRVFRYFIEKRPEKGKSPVSLRLLISAILSFGYFGFISVMTSLFGMIILPIIPYNKVKKLKIFRRVIAKQTKSVMYSNYGVKNVLNNPYNEKFDKPAIIIANHSSFLDTLSFGFMPVPFIFMVNEWVYHSPIFGKAVQAAGYFPTKNGIQGDEEKLAEIIKKGSFLAVFPEGTRSLTGSIARFHKGAFLLAQIHHIDIIPLYIHGNSNLLPKGDFIIFDGEHYLEIGKRITFDETTEQRNLKELTKEISRDFHKRFDEIRIEKEGVDYFKQKIYLNFLYKLPEIEKQGKAEFEANKEIYYKLNSKIGDQAEILRIGNDLGVWDLMLTLQQQKRKVYSYIENEYFRNIAKQSYLVHKRKLHYIDSLDAHKTNTLLISSALEDFQPFEDLLNSHRFDRIVLVGELPYLDIFTTFGYEIEEQTSDYTILKQSS